MKGFPLKSVFENTDNYCVTQEISFTLKSKRALDGERVRMRAYMTGRD